MQNSSPVRKHSTPQQREEILRSYRDSHLTQKQFAAQAGIGVSTLQAWRRKAAVNKGGDRDFVAVPNLLSALPAAPGYRLEWPDGLSLEVRSGFACEELAGLLQLLQRL